MELTTTQKIRLLADFPTWTRYWGTKDFRRQPELLPEALRDVSSHIRVPGLGHIVCSVLRGLLGLLEAPDQRRQAEVLAQDPHPNREQNRFPVAEIIVQKLRHPLVPFYRNPYNFLAAFQTAVKRESNFAIQYPIAVQRIRRSEAAKRRKERQQQQQQPATAPVQARRTIIVSQPVTNCTASRPLQPVAGSTHPRSKITRSVLTLVRRTRVQRATTATTTSTPPAQGTSTPRIPSLAPAPTPAPALTTVSDPLAAAASANGNTSSDSLQSPPPESPISISPTDQSPSPAGYLESGNTTPAPTPPPQSPIVVSDSDSIPSTPPPLYQEFDSGEEIPEEFLYDVFANPPDYTP